MREYSKNTLFLTYFTLNW